MTKKAFDKIKAGLDEALETAKQPVKGEDFIIELSPEVEAQIAADPELAKFLRSVMADIRQAADGTTSKEEFDERMRAMGAREIDLDDDESNDERKA